MNGLLSPQQVEEQLSQLAVEWSVVSGVSLSRVFKFPDFTRAINFVNKLAALAENANHHPDIEISYSKVTLHLTTHEASGLTQTDFQLAREIEKIPLQ